MSEKKQSKETIGETLSVHMVEVCVVVRPERTVLGAFSRCWEGAGG